MEETKIIASKPTFSVVLPCHENHDALYKAIDSVMQDVPKDCTLLILVHKNIELYSSLKSIYSISNIRIYQDNYSANLSGVLNYGIKLANSDYIFRMDSDDVWSKGRYSLQKNIVEIDRSIDVVGGSLEVFDPVLKRYYTINRNQSPSELRTELILNCVIAHPTVLYKKNSILEVGGYNEKLKYTEDFDLWSRMRENYKMTNIPEILIKYTLKSPGQRINENPLYFQELSHIISRNVTRYRFLDCGSYNHIFKSKLRCWMSMIYIKTRVKLQSKYIDCKIEREVDYSVALGKLIQLINLKIE
jgi:glycosyltransferase involved in cell wall biosynthesis